MAILKHTYKVAITRTNIGYDIVINEFATDGTHREYERRHHAWALTSHGADRAAQRLISRIKRQNQRGEHPHRMGNSRHPPAHQTRHMGIPITRKTTPGMRQWTRA